MLLEYDLRIGNWVIIKSTNITKWIQLERIENGDGVAYFGIPITAEVLDRFGFVKINDECYRHPRAPFWLYFKDGEWWPPFALPGYIQKLSFVHQVQNLIWDLCNYEMKLLPKKSTDLS